MRENNNKASLQVLSDVCHSSKFFVVCHDLVFELLATVPTMISTGTAPIPLYLKASKINMHKYGQSECSAQREGSLCVCICIKLLLFEPGHNNTYTVYIGQPYDVLSNLFIEAATVRTLNSLL